MGFERLLENAAHPFGLAGGPLGKLQGGRIAGMERISEREDTTVAVDIEVDITIGNFETIEELTGKDVGDTGVDIGIALRCVSEIACSVIWSGADEVQYSCGGDCILWEWSEQHSRLRGCRNPRHPHSQSSPRCTS